MPAAGAADAAQVRFAHLSPDSPAVDVALAPVPPGGGPLTDPGPDAVTGLAYGDVDAYRALAPGTYAVSVRAAGSPSDTPPALSTRIDVAPGAATTVTLSGLFDDLALETLPDDLSAPPAGSARVRVVTAATGTGPVTMTAAGTLLADALPFPGAGRYGVVPAGRADLRMDGASPLSVDLAAGSVVTLLVLDAGGGVEIRPVVDAAGAAVVPAGGVDAGAGPAATPVGVLVVIGLAALRRIRVPLLVVAAAATVLVGVADAPPAAAAPGPVAVSVGTTETAAAPVRVRARGIDAAVAPVAVDGSAALAAPDDPAVAGWFAGGPVPGDVGPAVLTAHVDWAGAPAAFAALDGLRPGDQVTVERADGSVVRFEVTRVVRAPKDAFPTAEVYGPTPDAQLRLITCGGRFDRATGGYADNVLVFATAI